MSSKVLSGRRQVYPVESMPVIVPGYQLTFDVAGLPYFEPGFGTIQPIDDNGKYSSSPDCQVGSPMHCVAHLITKKELAHIVNTEGGSGNPDFGYQLIEVSCETYSGKKIVGTTLFDTSTFPNGHHPSVRYYNIIMDGSREYGLSPSYIKRLEQVTPYVARTTWQKMGKYLFFALALPLALPVFLFAMAGLLFKLKMPRPVAVYGEWAKRFLWVMHDRIFAPIFGKGY